MNTLNQLISGEKTLEQLKRKNMDEIISIMHEWIKKEEHEQNILNEVFFSPEKYEAFREENEALKYVNYSDMVALVKIEEETHMQPERNTNRAIARYMEITNRILIRKLANDFCKEDVDLYYNHYSQDEIENRNDRVYRIFEELGYEGQEDSHISRLIEGNFKLFQEKEKEANYTKTLIEIEERMRYLLKYLSSQPHSASIISHDSINYIMKHKNINSIMQELYGSRITFKGVEKMRMKRKDELYKIEDAKRSKYREPDVYNRCQQLCDELANNPQMEINMDTYQQLADYWFDTTTHEAMPSVKSGFQEYKGIKGLQYLRPYIYKRIEGISEKLLHSRRIKNYFKYSFKERNNYDSLVKKMVLLYDIRKEKEKPDPKFELLDAAEKAIKGLWHFSGAVADATLKGVDLASQNVKRRIHNYRLKKPTPNAVLYVGKHVLIEKIDSHEK